MICSVRVMRGGAEKAGESSEKPQRAASHLCQIGGLEAAPLEQLLVSLHMLIVQLGQTLLTLQFLVQPTHNMHMTVFIETFRHARTFLK